MSRTASEHVYVDADGNVVPGDDPRAATLAAAPGDPINADLGRRIDAAQEAAEKGGSKADAQPDNKAAGRSRSK